jgi:uncharacterized oligopeptide transporter (OPT) family protein
MDMTDTPSISSNGVISLTFPQSERDFRAAVELRSAHWSTRLLSGSFALATTYGIVVLVWGLVVGPIDSLVPVVMISAVLWVACYFGFNRLQVWGIMRRLVGSKQGSLMGSTCTVTVEDGVLATSVEANGVSMRMPVSQLERVDETESHVFLWTTTVNVIPIPRHSVPESDLDALVDSLSAGISPLDPDSQ